MGRWHRSRPWPVLSPSPFGLRRTSRDGAARLLRTRMSVWDGRFCCKQQRIYKAPLMQTPDAFRPPGAIPTVDFLLAHFRAFAKKVPVKSLVGAWTLRAAGARFALPTLQRRLQNAARILQRYGPRLPDGQRRHLGGRVVDLGFLEADVAQA